MNIHHSCRQNLFNSCEKWIYIFVNPWHLLYWSSALHLEFLLYFHSRFKLCICSALTEMIIQTCFYIFLWACTVQILNSWLYTYNLSLSLYSLNWYNMQTCLLPKKTFFLLIFQNTNACVACQWTILQRLDQRNIPTFPEGDILIFVMSTCEYLSSNSFSLRIVSGSP